MATAAAPTPNSEFRLDQFVSHCKKLKWEMWTIRSFESLETKEFTIGRPFDIFLEWIPKFDNTKTIFHARITISIYVRDQSDYVQKKFENYGVLELHTEMTKDPFFSLNSNDLCLHHPSFSAYGISNVSRRFVPREEDIQIIDSDPFSKPINDRFVISFDVEMASCMFSKDQFRASRLSGLGGGYVS